MPNNGFLQELQQSRQQLAAIEEQLLRLNRDGGIAEAKISAA